MPLEIKLSPRWRIIDNPHSSSGVILERQIKSNNSSKVRIENTYHQSVSHALDFYARVVISKNDKKVKSIREYIDEYDNIFKDGVDKIEKAQQYFETDVTPKKNSSK